MIKPTTIMQTLKLSVVIVTYGQRWKYLKQVLDSLTQEEVVTTIIIIDNASVDQIQERCNTSGYAKVNVYRNDRNIGSAGGFSLGIKKAYELNAGLILLLDDDNLPRKGTLQHLLATYERLLTVYHDRCLAVICFRQCHHGRFRVLKRKLFKPDDHFLHFNIFNAFQRYLGFVKKEKDLSSGPEYAEFSQGVAYSGLLLPRKTIEVIGYPNELFILYYDDLEYTRRILNKGGAIWLDTDAILDDIESNYSMSAIKLPLLGFIVADSDIKVYYLIRNNVYADYHIKSSNSLYYHINEHIFLIAMFVLCFFLLRFSRWRTIMHAYRDGKRGLLGMNSRYSLDR